MRKLATIRQITSVEPIKGKDRVEMAHVDGWTCMVSKTDSFTSGSLCVFCEPDSVFPQTEQWEFLKKYNYRIKTQKFKDGDGNPIYSQGLVLPLSAVDKLDAAKAKVGDDVTGLLMITQYEPTMDVEDEVKTKKKYPQWLMSMGWFRKLVLKKKSNGKFPDFISKTDEERIQNVPNILEEDVKWCLTEKIDGQSGSFAVVKHRKLLWNRYEFFVCSRNLRKPYPDNSSYWRVAEKYDLKNKLTEALKHLKTDWIAIQGECIAPNVQGNKYSVSKPDLYVFNVITPNTGRWSSNGAKTFVEGYGLKFVPIIENDVSLKSKTVEDVLKMSDGKSMLCDTLREGIVFRSMDGKKSFKAVSPEFLIKHGE